MVLNALQLRNLVQDALKGETTMNLSELTPDGRHFVAAH
jgi:hypothetical protein